MEHVNSALLHGSQQRYSTGPTGLYGTYTWHLRDIEREAALWNRPRA